MTTGKIRKLSGMVKHVTSFSNTVMLREDKALTNSAIGNKTTNTVTTASAAPEGKIEAGRTWSRLYCKDYGGSCTIKVSLRKGGVVKCELEPLVVPLDEDKDNLADLYEKRQLVEWKVQYKLSNFDTNDLAFFTGLSDREELDPDGSGVLGPHRTEGDGLRASEEYRGYVVDGGPKNFNGGHVRISLAKKELLVEVSEMPGIQSSISAGENPGVTYSLSSTQNDIGNLYCHETRGAGIDVYWARDEIVSGGKVDYNRDGAQNGDDRPNVYIWAGSVDKINGKTNLNGGAYVMLDYKLRKDNRTQYDEYFRDSEGTVAEYRRHHQHNRNTSLEAFAKLFLISRSGLVYETNETHATTWCQVSQVGPALSSTAQANHTLEGCYVAVTGVAEEGVYSNVGTHYTSVEFANVFGWAVAHELGHLVINAARHPGGAPPSLMCIDPPGRGGISIIQMNNAELIELDLANKGSVP